MMIGVPHLAVIVTSPTQSTLPVCSYLKLFQSNLFPGPPTKKAKLDRSDSDDCDKSDSTSVTTSYVDIASGWGDASPVGNTPFGGGGWGCKTPDVDEKDVSWEPPVAKGIGFFLFFDF